MEFKPIAYEATYTTASGRKISAYIFTDFANSMDNTLTILGTSFFADDSFDISAFEVCQFLKSLSMEEKFSNFHQLFLTFSEGRSYTFGLQKLSMQSLDEILQHSNLLSESL